MHANINNVTICGHVVRPPARSPGAKVAGLRIATTDAWKDRAGDRHSRTDFHAVSVVTPHLVDMVMEQVKVGDLVYVEGALQTRKVTNEAGTRTFVEVVVLPTSGVFKIVRANDAPELAAQAHKEVACA